MVKRRLIGLVLISVFIYIACDTAAPKGEEQSKTTATSDKKDGEALAKIYCGSCHQFPEPTRLNKLSWKKYMLPRMGYMLGIYKNKAERDSLFEKGRAGKIVRKANVFPENPVIDEKSWKKIQDYYMENAPEELTAAAPKSIKVGLQQFRVKKPSFTISPPSTTMAKFTDDNEIFVGDAHSKKLLQFSSDMELIKAGNVDEGAVWLEEINNELWITVMGSFSPSDEPKGFVLNLPKEGGKVARVVADNLQRPVHTAYADLTGNGKMDMVVSEFGQWTGGLSLFVNQGNKNFKKKKLINQSGAIRSYLRDFNNDGKLDIIALFAQGNEAIYILYNEGAGNFRQERVLQFSPSNGSCYFNLYDFNHDGHLDIIYAAGDNADFNPIMKPYHGVYIFENDGKNRFKETFFYHLNGAYAAIPRDYDLDGDMDIAAISFFPDYENSPEESFVYLENKGDYQLEASTFEDVTMGRWLIMDAKDIDNDGDEDLILGSLAFEVIPDNGLVSRWVKEGLPYVILENTAR